MNPQIEYDRTQNLSMQKQNAPGNQKFEYGDTHNMSTEQQNEAGYPESEYGNTRNMSIKQQNEAEYPKYEYSDTYNASMAGKLIRAQGGQIRRMSAEEYLKDKSRETVKRNRGLLSKISTEAGRKRA